MTTATANYESLVQELYVAYFGRPADEAGLTNFEAALAVAHAPTTLTGLLSVYSTNPVVASLIDAFGNSAESGRLYGTNITSSSAAAQSFVTAVFESLFNRAPLNAGLTFWSNAITSGNLTPGEAALAIAAGAGTADSATIANKLAAAADFTNDLTSHGDVGLTTYQGSAAAAEGRTFLAQINGTTTPAIYDAFAAATTNAMVNGAVPPPIPTPTPTPTPPPPSTLALTVAGDTIHLNSTTAASTVSLSGADLTAFPLATYGTVAELVTAGVLHVTDSGGNFTLNASGNNSATTFNFGTGVISGADAVSAAGITYGGVSTFVTSNHGGDTVTLSAATQNVTASNDGNTINLGGLVYTGTLNLNAGSGGTDTINASVGNLGGATISGTGGNAHIALVLSSPGTETLSTAEYNLITSTTGGSITFTGSTGGTDHITFSNGGIVTAIANVNNYNLSSTGNTITLTNVVDNVTGEANGGTDTVILGALAYAGTLAFGSGGTDSVHVTVGGNISGGTITSSGASVGLALSGAGTETLNTAQYNLFNPAGISGGSFGGDTITLSNGGTVTANANVGNYHLSTAGNTITLNNVADNVTGAASGNDTVNLAALAYTGTVAFGASGSDAIHVTVGSNISGGTITTGGATVALVFSGPGTETMTTAEYNLFNATSISGGSFGGDTITLSNAGTVTANANVGNYDLSTAGNTITLTNAAAHVTGAASGNDIVNLAALAYTGTLAFGAAGTDTVHVTVGSDISGGTITSGGATVALVLSGTGTETLNTDEYNLFNATGIAGGSFGANTIIFANGGTVTANANVGNYDLSGAGNTITLTDVADNVAGAATGTDVVDLAALAYTGTVAFGAGGSDAINVTVGGDISGGTITTGGATVALVFSSAGTETMTTAQYNLFDAGGISGGSFAGDTIALTDAGTETANVNVGNYNLYNGGGTTITLTDAADNVSDSGAIGGDSINLGALTYTGNITVGTGATADMVVGAVSHNISGATITSSGVGVGLEVVGAGSESISSAEFTLFKATEINFSTGGGNTLYVSPVADTPLTLIDTDFANFSNTQNLQIGSTGIGAQSITLGTDFGAQLVSALTTTSSTGTITIDASATTTAATFTASSTGAGGNIGITGGTGGDTINATIVAGSTVNVTSNGTDAITLNTGAGTASIIATGVDTVDLGAGHTNGNDTLTLYQTANGTHVTNWMANDELDLSIANFTGANAIYGNSGTVSTIAAQTAHTENIVAFSAAQTSNVGDDLYDMGATTFANAAALATFLNNGGNALTFASGTVPAAGASLLFEYEDGSGNAHLALVQLANGATSTTAATAVDIVELVGLPSTSSLHNIHLA